MRAILTFVALLVFPCCSFIVVYGSSTDTANVAFHRRSSSKPRNESTYITEQRKKAQKASVASRQKRTVERHDALEKKTAMEPSAAAAKKKPTEVDTTLRLLRRASSNNGDKRRYTVTEKGLEQRRVARKASLAARQKRMVERHEAIEKKNEAEKKQTEVDTTLHLRRRSETSMKTKRPTTEKQREAGKANMTKAREKLAKMRDARSARQLMTDRATFVNARSSNQADESKEVDTTLRLRRSLPSSGYTIQRGGRPRRPPGSNPAPYKKSPRQAEASRANAQKARDKKAENYSKGVTTKLSLRRRSDSGGKSTSSEKAVYEPLRTSRPYTKSSRQAAASRKNLEKANQEKRMKAAEKRYGDGEPNTDLSLRRRSSGGSGGKAKKEYEPLRKKRPYKKSEKSEAAIRANQKSSVSAVQTRHAVRFAGDSSEADYREVDSWLTDGK